MTDINNENNNEQPKDGYQFIDEDEVITLEDNDGNSVDFYHRLTMVINGQYYIALEAAQDCDDAMQGECILLKILQDEDGEDYYASIDDEAEEALVEERLNEILEEEEEENEEYGEYEDEN